MSKHLTLSSKTSPLMLTACLRRLALAALLLSLVMLSAIGALAQNTGPTDGSTPLGMKPGASAGSYALSGFDSVNPFNGHLNFNLPLLKIGGRGTVGDTLTLPIETHWNVRDEFYQLAHHYYVDPDIWSGLTTGYGGGVLNGRLADSAQMPCSVNEERSALTRLTFTAADGTEYELHDTAYNGQPLTNTYASTTCAIETTHSRGKVFVTSDGTGVTFISDEDIWDYYAPGVSQITPSGYLLLKDGTRYRIEEGRVTWARDRNGNKLTFPGFNGATATTDSLNREVTVSSGSASGHAYDDLNYKGFGGASRAVRVWHSPLSQVLPTGVTPQTYKQLFTQMNAASTTTQHNPGVVSSVELPDGRSYQFRYNSYGELARVELPTGGAFEYDYDWGVTNGPVAGVSGTYRRVVEKRVYADGVTLESRMTFSRPESTTTNAGYVEVKQLDAGGALLSQVRHYYYGSAKSSFFQAATGYAGWKDGKEWKTEVYDIVNNSAVLRRVSEQTWQQPVSGSTWPLGQAETSDYAKANNPQVTESTTTLVETNQVTKQTFSYDQYGNQTDVYEYDYGTGSAGALIRRSHTDYLTTNTVNSTDYTANTIHIRSLPTQQSVFAVVSSTEVERALSTFEYDNYANNTTHHPLLDRSLISGLDSAFTTSYQTRGNVTATTHYLLNTSGTVTGSISAYAQYDIAGNVVKAIDGRGYSTLLDYSDRYGAPNTDARLNAGATELGTKTSYAFPTLVTNALEQTAYTQYDYYSGVAVDAEDANGVVSSGYYNDALGRPTQLISAASTTLRRQTTFSYDDVNRVVTTTSDLSSFNDNLLKSETLFDGLGRSTETRSYENSTDFIAVRAEYDALGRSYRSTNHFRTGETIYWTTNAYDALGRVLTVTTPDGAQVSTAYSGNTVTVTDQASKQRKSVTDALGRLTQVTEAPNDTTNYNFQTSYAYDVLGNLRTVTQGAQTRTFVYDSLSRLTSATNPESGTISYQYDNNGNLANKSDARTVSVVTTYAYDALNRPTSRSYSDGTPTVTYTYDTLTNGIGRLTSVSSSVSVYNYSGYDALGRLTGSSQVTDRQTYSMGYAYDLAGNLTSQTYPSGRVVTTSYDSAGRLSQVSGQKTGEANKTYVNSFSYTSHGAIKDVKLGNDLWEHSSFNTRLQPIEIGLGTTQGGIDHLKLNYAYGTTTNNGNVQTQTITIPGGQTLSQSYTYDALNRLKSAEEMNGGSQSWKQTFIYDRFGSRNFDTANTTANALGSLLTIDQANNRFTSGQGSILYDNAGNLTRDFSGHTFGYDGENHQTSYDGGATANGTDYKYDGDGRRVKKVNGTAQATTVFVYNAMGQLVAEYDNTTPQGSGGTSYLTADNLGTPRVITDASGAVKARHDYLPFGEELQAGMGGRTQQQGYVGDNVRQGFVGYEHDDETGLDFAQARYYANLQGRFTSADPLLASGRPADPQTWNRYVYCRNNPLVYVDPSGLDWWYDSEAKEATPTWYDKDPGGKWKRWTDISGYVYQDSSDPGVWVALNPNKQQGFITNTREKAQAAEDGHTGSGIGLSMTPGQRDFWAGAGAGLGGPASWFLGKIAGAGGVDTTSRDYRAGLLFGSAGFAGATTVGNIGSSLADDAAGATPQIIYRSGKTNPGNLTDPRGLSFRDSLSNPYPLAPGQRPVFGHGDSYFGINTSNLPRGSVIFDNIPPGHVTVTGVTPAILKDAATQTGIRGNFPK
jgi:RHS repeat-associated protein